MKGSYDPFNVPRLTEADILRDWRPNDRYVGTCARCGREKLKRRMVSLYVKKDSYSPVRILCHLCADCLPAILDGLGVSMPDE